MAEPRRTHEITQEKLEKALHNMGIDDSDATDGQTIRDTLLRINGASNHASYVVSSIFAFRWRILKFCRILRLIRLKNSSYYRLCLKILKQKDQFLEFRGAVRNRIPKIFWLRIARSNELSENPNFSLLYQQTMRAFLRSFLKFFENNSKF